MCELNSLVMINWPIFFQHKYMMLTNIFEEDPSNLSINFRIVDHYVQLS